MTALSNSLETNPFHGLKNGIKGKQSGAKILDTFSINSMITTETLTNWEIIEIAFYDS